LYRKTRGRARKELDKKAKKNDIYEGQTELYDQIKFMTMKSRRKKNNHKHLEEEKVKR